MRKFWQMNSWKEFGEEYGEAPQEHFDNPAEYWDSVGDHKRANAIRARWRKMEEGQIEEVSDE